MHLQVVACLGDYFELRCCQPKTQKLRELLSECPYKGPEYEGGLVDLGASESMDTFPEGVQKKRKGPHKVMDGGCVWCIAWVSNYVHIHVEY